MRNTTLYEGGKPRRLDSLAQMETDLRLGKWRYSQSNPNGIPVGSGHVIWVPAIDYLGMNKYIHENGTYKVADEAPNDAGDGFWAYMKVTVNVAGGAADLESADLTDSEQTDPEQWDTDDPSDPQEPEETGETVVQDVKPATDGKIIGKDPEGKPIEVTAKDGKITTREVTWPVGIKITKKPTKLHYASGEMIDLTGIEVKLVKADGSIYTDERYPNGVVNVGSLVAQPSAFVGSDGLPDGVYESSGAYEADSVCIQVSADATRTELNYVGFTRDDIRYAAYWDSQKPDYLEIVGVSMYPHTLQHLQTVGSRSVLENAMSSSSKTINGVTYHVSNGWWSSPIPVPTSPIADVGTLEEAVALMANTQQVMVLWSPLEYGIGGYYMAEFHVGESIGKSEQESFDGSWGWFLAGS